MKQTVVKKKTKKSKIMTNKLKYLGILAAFFQITSSLFFTNINLSLNHQYQDLQAENNKLRLSNQTLVVKIEELTSFENLSAIANKKGLKNYENTIKNFE